MRVQPMARFPDQAIPIADDRFQIANVLCRV
jgi:hypothetical protein